MCGSWEKIVVDQRRCRRILKQVKQCVLPIFAFLRLNTTFNIKSVEKVVLRRKNAKMGKTHCFTCFKMRLHLRWSTTIFSQLPHIEKVVLRRNKAKMGKTHCFTCFKMRLHLRWSTTIFCQLPHMRTTISPDLWIVYIPMNRSTCILTLKVSKSRVKAQQGKNGQNALFHLLQNAPTLALIYHDFLPTSTHAHNSITRSLDSLHPNE